MKREKGEAASMVAPKSREQVGAALFLVEDLAAERNYASWFVASLRQATGWAPGKQVTQDEFNMAVTRFSARAQGSGKI